MKQLKSKKRRSSWLHFAIAGAVLVGLSLGHFSNGTEIASDSRA